MEFDKEEGQIEKLRKAKPHVKRRFIIRTTIIVVVVIALSNLFFRYLFDVSFFNSSSDSNETSLVDVFVEIKDSFTNIFR